MSNLTKQQLDALREYLIRQNPNHKGSILIPEELLQAAARGELPQHDLPVVSESQPPTEALSAIATEVGPSGTNRQKARKPSTAQDVSNGEEPERKRGRPAHYPPWLEAAAQLVANGYTLRRALWRLGVSIPEKQLRQVYRWKHFREAYEDARRVFFTDWGVTSPRKVEGITRSILSDWERLTE
jgi:hypothetical protein